MLVGSGRARIAFLSDHEGWGNLYSLGAGRHRPAPAHRPRRPRRARFYARHASTDGQPGRLRVRRASCGSWTSWTPDAQPRRLDIRLGGPRTAREPYRVHTADRAGARRPRTAPAGPASSRSAAPCTGSPTATARPARCSPTPGVRARLARPLGADRAVVGRRRRGRGRDLRRPARRAGRRARSRRAGSAAGELGRVLELAPAPDGSAVALAAHDGRLLVLDLADRRAARAGPRAPTARSPTCAGRRTAPGWPTATRSSRA